MSRFGVDRDPVVRFEDQVGFGPLHPGLGLPRHLCGQLDLAASLGRQARQQFGIQLNLWRLYVHEEKGKPLSQMCLQKILYSGWLYPSPVELA